MRCLWLQEALAGEEDAPALAGDERADVCIVGGGFTGLWTAIRLKEADPALDVALVEADVCGGGASGRNGGFVLSWWAKLGSLAGLVGAEEALRLARASADAVAGIGAFCEEHGIDAHVRHDGWLWTATSPAQVGAWEEAIALAAAHGAAPFERLEPDEVARRAGSATHLAGVFEPTAATVQPALLARGLRRVALERGVRVYERSRMTGLDRGRPPRVRTAGGSIAAEKVVLALNAWGASVRELRRAVVVIASDVVATAAVPDRLRELGWSNGLCIDDSRMLVNYYRTTLDGRIVFGKGGGALAFGGRVGDAFEGESERAAEVTECLRTLYPMLRDVPVEASWKGPIDRSRHGLPAFGRLGGNERILFGLGYSGNGVGPTYLGGRILASLALGRDDEWAGCGLVGGVRGTFPPEPARYLGGVVVRAAVARKERAEDAGRRPSRLDRFLTGLAPAGLVPQPKDAP